MAEYERLKEIFLEFIEQPPEERRAFLEAACAGDPGLRAGVEWLLNHHHRASGFLANPTFGAGAFDEEPPAFQLLEGSIPGYRILREIGQGGMGIVYEAEQVHPRRRVALKVIRPGLTSPTVLRRFEHEAEILGRLRHPGIAQIIQAGTAQCSAGPLPFFAMEFIEGEPLTDHAIRRDLSTAQRIDIFAKVCDVVEHAHQRGVVHRDLKPANILVEEAEGKHQPKILDFGVARLSDAEEQVSLLTNTGQVLGTMPYMSPEQVSGAVKDLDSRSDVYSLGVVLYELITGRLPYSLAHLALPAAARVIQEIDPPRLSAVVKRPQGDLETIAAKALAKEKGRRYQSASALGDDLRRFSRDEPILARPTSKLYLLNKFARRNKPLVAGILIALAALTAGISVTGWLAWSEARERRRSDLQTYRANIAAASASLQAGNGLRARHLLDEIAPERRASWEWRHLNSRLDSCDRVLAVPDPAVLAVAFSPDSRYLATAGTGGAVRLWNTQSWQLLRVLPGTGCDVLWLTFSPDGAILASALKDGTILLRKTESGEGVRRFRELTTPVKQVAFSPNGRLLAVLYSQAKKLIVWSLDTSEKTFLLDLPNAHRALEFSPDGRELATAAGANIWRFRVEDWKPLPELGGETQVSTVFSTTYSPDGSRLAAIFVDQLLQVWDLQSGRLLQVTHGKVGGANALSFTADSRTVITASSDQGLHGWDTVNERETEIRLGHSQRIWALACSRDGSWIASGAQDQTVRIWRAAPEIPGHVLRGHDNFVYGVRFSPRDPLIASAAWDHTVRLWDAVNGEEVAVLRGHTQPATEVAFSPDGALLASISYDYTIKLWDIPRPAGGRGARERSTVSLRGRTRYPRRLTFSASGAWLASLCQQSVVLWRVNGDGSISEAARLDREAGQLESVAFLNESPTLLVQDWSEIRWWNPGTNEVVLLSRCDARERFWVSCLSRDGSSYAVCRDRDILLWKVEGGKPGLTLRGTLRGQPYEIYSLTFSPDGSRLASGGGENLIRIWDVANGVDVLELQGHRGSVIGLDFSPDGTQLVSGSGDRTLRVWDTLPRSERLGGSPRP